MRWIVGLLLIAAAVLKAVEVYLYPATAIAGSVFSVGWSRILLPLQISFEFGLGLAVLLGVCWQHLRWVVAALFGSFCCYTLYLGIHGATSCGCFGPLAISPWWSFSIDLGVLAGLVLGGKARYRVDHQQFEVEAERLPSVNSSLVGIVAVSLITTLGLIWQLRPQDADNLHLLESIGNLTILEPEDWVGQAFPLASSVDVDITNGDWIVLLHRHDCPKCQEALPKYELLAASEADLDIATIEVPPYDDANEHIKHCLCGRLTSDREWFVQTPVEIKLADGIVVSASRDLPALDEDRTQSDG